MKIKTRIKFGVFLLIGILLTVSLVSATYSSSINPNYGLFGSYTKESSIKFDNSMCEAGQDFVIQIAPFGCTPAVVRTDLLEEQNVPVFCQLGATQINPLIDVEAIESISFPEKEFSREFVSDVGFHPAKAALGVTGDINSPVLNNIGYLVIVLKKQTNASAIPDFVEGSLTAKIKYDIKNAFGIGDASFYLPELSEKEWEDKKVQYRFWDGKGYLRAEAIDDDSAIISLYDDTKKISTVNLEKGETSNKIYMPGFDCLAGLKLKLNNLESPDTKVKLRINAEVIEVKEGEKFLENGCYVIKNSIKKQGFVQEVQIRCKEDEGVERFKLSISPKVKLNFEGAEEEYVIGDQLYSVENGEKFVYLGYVGENSKGTKFIIPVVSPAKNSEEFKKTLIYSKLPFLVKSIQYDVGNPILGLIKGIYSISGAGVLNFLNFLVTGSYPVGFIYEDDSGEEEVPVSGGVLDQIPFISDLRKINFVGFAGAVDRELGDKNKEYYEKAMDDYKIILDSFSTEEYSDKTTYGEETLYKQIILASDMEQKKTVVDLCEKFKQKYLGSNKNLNDYCNEYKVSNSEIATGYVTINGKTKKISFDGIYEPDFEEYGAEVFVSGFDKDENEEIMEKKMLMKGTEIPLLKEDSIELISLDEDSITIKLNVKETISNKVENIGTTKTVKLNDYINVGKNNYKITVNKINLKKIAKVSVISNIDNAGTEANFSFKIGIEKRAIELSPEKTRAMIESLNKTIEDWTKLSESLGKVVKGLKTACLGVGAVLTVKNFFANTGGKAIARQEVMRGEGGWYERCADLVSSGEYTSQEQCMVEKADNIEEEVDSLYDVMQEQNTQIKELEEGITEKKFLSESVVDEEKFMERYSPKVQEYLDDNFGDTFEDPEGKGESIDMVEMKTILSYEGWEENKYDTEQLREIELYSMVLKNEPDNEVAKKRLYSVLLDVQENSKNYANIANWADDLGVSTNQIGFLETGEKAKELSYDGLKNVDLSSPISAFSEDTPIKVLQTSGGEKYIIALDDSSGTDILPIKRDDSNNLMIYYSNGNLVSTEDIPSELKNVYFKKYDRTSYENKYKSPELRYYETEPYKGLPAVVPFDVNDGWYAATKPTLSTFGGVSSYDKSGRVTSFYLCNVGKNGIEEFESGIGDDICQMINTGTGQPYNQFAGLEESEAIKRIEAGIKSIEQASKQYKSGVNKVNINVGYGNINLDVGSPAVDVSEMQCQDFMSPKDCQLMFNVCDPVICPSSRCDFGGTYPVKDVIQSGIIGSIVLCLPNFKEGIYVPVCLTGIKAGIDGLISVFTSYRDCLQNSLETGEMVGVCDEIYSVYMCEFLWRQALPLAKIAIPKMMEWVMGQNLRGGGEYLGVQSAWKNAENSIDYFTNYYASNSYSAFNVRTLEEAGGEICKSYVSGVYPDGGNLLDSLTEPDSPSQFYGRFEEIPFTTTTVPATSQYKVFYHIYAGEEAGVYYKVYLKGNSESSFYQDVSSSRMVASGYIAAAGYASETEDFTAPSGYQELCIMVNNQEECGFQQVSTDFTVNYVKDKYAKSQASKTDITSESECISGSASAYSLLNPNIQEGVDEAINPKIYNQGIIRICATDNPGKGTDAYAGTEDARWIEVGYCDDNTIKCWLDTDSVEDVIKSTEIEEDTLQEVTENQLEILRNEEGYISEEEFEKAINEINDEDDLSKKISLINDIFDEVFFNSEKTILLFLRGNAYAELVGKIGITKVKGDEEETEDVVSGRIYNILNKGENLPDYGYTEARCAGYCTKAAKELFGLKYNNADAWCREVAGDKLIKKWEKPDKKNNADLKELIESGIVKPGMIIGVYLPYSDPEKNSNISSEHRSYAYGKTWDCGKENVVIKYTHNILYVGKNEQGELIFIESFYYKWKDEAKKKKLFIPSTRTLEGFDVKGDKYDFITMAVFDAPEKVGLSLFFNEENAVPEVESEGSEEGVSDEILKLTNAGERVLTVAEELDGTTISPPYDDSCWSKVRYVYEKAGVKQSCVYSDSKGKQYSGISQRVLSGKVTVTIGASNNIFLIASYPKTSCLLNKEYNSLDVEEEIKLDELKPGYILSVVQNNKAGHNIIFIKWKDKSKRIAEVFHGTGNKFEYTEYDLSDDDGHPVYMFWKPVISEEVPENAEEIPEQCLIEEIEEIPEKIWTLDTAIEEVKGLKGTYSDNKEFVDQLYEDEILTDDEYKEITGKGFFNLQENMNWLKKVLLEKLAKRNKQLDNIINGIESLPVYTECQGGLYCARYSTMLAEELFNYEYYQTDVWCRSVLNMPVWKTLSFKEIYKKSSSELDKIREENEDDLDELERQGILKPGVIFGVYYPATSSGVIYGEEVECEGFGVSVEPYYTHNLLYLGKNDNSEMVFAELFSATPEIRTLNEFKKDGFVIMEIFAPPKK